MLKEIKKIARSYYFYLKNYFDRKRFEKILKEHQGRDIKLVIGSEKIYQKGWIPTEAHFLNLLVEEDWFKYFEENSIDCIMAEHVWEHLTPEEGEKAIQVCRKFLKEGGRLRIAVPDGYHKSPEYIDCVKPGGTGSGSDDHKVLYNYTNLGPMLERNGYTIKILEHYDENKEFHYELWDIEYGKIRRSLKYDKRNKNGIPNFTSLIIDAIKK